MQDLPMTLPALADAYAAGASPAAVVTEVYRRIYTVDDPGIFIDLFALDAVLAEAEALGSYDPDLPLWGVPFAIKDNIDAAGHPTTAGCPAYAYDPVMDATVVARLRAAGALLIGKTNLDQFATGLVGVRSPYPPPRNALDPEIVPGGSSSGSAVAVGHGLVAFSLGTDTAGSGRVPAALNNIVGLKPTLGALSATGVVPACRTLDTISIFALSVADAHQVLTVAAAPDPSHAYSRAVPVAPLGPVPPRFRVGVPDANSLETFGDTAQADSFAAALDALRAVGAEIVPVDFEPFNAVAEMLYRGAWVAERHTVIADLLARDPGAIHPVTRQIIRLAEGMSAADAFRGMYRLKELAAQTAPIIDGVDLFCVPTIPTFYSVADLAADPIGPNNRLGTYTNFVNLLDMAGIAVPTGPRSDGRPGSVTFLGKAGTDGWLASVADAIESRHPVGATPWSIPASPPPAPVAGPDELAIAVCGAHMSGLPLNHQLTERGGRLLAATTTAPRYRLYALAGGPPYRPGMVQDTASGVSVPVEVWAVPSAHVGSFLAGIPSPLGLGQVHLADGTMVTGFLCESVGLAGATEIDAAAGWRGYLAETV